MKIVYSYIPLLSSMVILASALGLLGNIRVHAIKLQAKAKSNPDEFIVSGSDFLSSVSHNNIY
jgi:hypothetical protein